MSQHDYTHLVSMLETYLAAHPPDGHPHSLYEPITYINGLGGKRIRPVMLLMAYNLWFDDVTPALPAAQAVEYFHNFSLMHDDIMDEAMMRRGQESVHTRFGRNAAILSGDALMIKSLDLLIDLDQKYKLASSLASVMAKISLEICEGQQMDMDFEKMTSPAEDDYIEMIRKKTACLIGACMKMGAFLAGASHDVANKLYGFGENLGLAFQIHDDMLDTFGDSSVTGKQQGGDILRGKKNFLYVKTLNTLSGRDRKAFIGHYEQVAKDGNISGVLDTYRALEVGKYAAEIENTYYESAMRSLEDLQLDTSMLVKFATGLMGRKY